MSDASPFDEIVGGADEATHFEVEEPTIDDAPAHGEASHADDPFGEAPEPAPETSSHEQHHGGFDSFDEAPAAAEGAVLVLGDAPSETVGAEDPFGEHHDGDANNDDIVFGSASGATESASVAAAAASASLLPVETPLSRWETERRQVLEDRREAERVAKLKAGDDARAELAAFYKRREETLEATQARNRVEEKNARADLDAVMSNGTQWEKVARMANLSATSGEGRDVARMRKLLIQLKMAKPTADGRGAAVGLHEVSDSLDVPAAPAEGTRRSPSPSGAAAAAAKGSKKR